MNDNVETIEGGIGINPDRAVRAADSVVADTRRYSPRAGGLMVTVLASSVFLSACLDFQPVQPVPTTAPVATATSEAKATVVGSIATRTPERTATLPRPAATSTPKPPEPTVTVKPPESKTPVRTPTASAGVVDEQRRGIQATVEAQVAAATTTAESRRRPSPTSTQVPPTETPTTTPRPRTGETTINVTPVPTTPPIVIDGGGGSSIPGVDFIADWVGDASAFIRNYAGYMAAGLLSLGGLWLVKEGVFGRRKRAQKAKEAESATADAWSSLNGLLYKDMRDGGIRPPAPRDDTPELQAERRRIIDRMVAAKKADKGSKEIGEIYTRAGLTPPDPYKKNIPERAFDRLWWLTKMGALVATSPVWGPIYLFSKLKRETRGKVITVSGSAIVASGIGFFLTGSLIGASLIGVVVGGVFLYLVIKS